MVSALGYRRKEPRAETPPPSARAHACVYSQVYAATFHPDKGTPLLATASADSKIKLWSTARERQL